MGVFLFGTDTRIEEDSMVGAVLREQNALPCGRWITVSPTAKDDVDNVGAGRAAKGANPLIEGGFVFSEVRASFAIKREWQQPFPFDKNSVYFSNVSSTISASTALTETLLIPFITPLLDL